MISYTFLQCSSGKNTDQPEILVSPLHLLLRRQRNENLRMSLYHRPQKEQKQKQIR